MDQKKWVYLSHFYTSTIPTYGEEKTPVSIEKIKCPSQGDSCEVNRFTLENHWGSHVDCEAHFFPEIGKRLTDYPPESWVFSNPYLFPLSVSPGLIIHPEHLGELPQSEVAVGADLILFQTGFEKWRGEPDYSKNNPGFHPETGIFLRKNFPNLQAIGFDFISLSSFQNRMLGREAHKAFLNPNGEGKSLRIFEDLSLKNLQGNPLRVFAFPLLLQGVDGGPVTMVAECQP